MRILFLSFFTFFVFAQSPEVSELQGNNDDNVVYKYKQYQEFDLETIGVEGEVGAPEDLTLNSRFQKKFRNKLPIRKNFNPEIRRTIELIR